MAARSRVFLLSPARLDGQRGKLLFEPASLFPIARALRTREGCPIGEVFRFVSGLYFRGKLAYATAFARPPEGAAWLGNGALVITQNRGLVPASTRICLEHLEAFASTDIRPDEPVFRKPFVRDARLVAEAIGDDGEVVLLGSIASAKYVDALIEVLGDRLLFPSDFVGRGDMSRGGLLLRAVDAKTELPYVPVKGAVRKGTRPAKLVPRYVGNVAGRGGRRASAEEGKGPMTTTSIRVTHSFKVASERVYDAFLDPEKARKFLFATPTGEMVKAEVDARAGGQFLFVDRRDGEDVEHVGEYIELVRPTRLVFDFAVPKFSRQKTRVTIDIAATASGCDLTLTHDGVLPEYIERTKGGWAAILGALATELDRPARA